MTAWGFDFSATVRPSPPAGQSTATLAWTREANTMTTTATTAPIGHPRHRRRKARQDHALRQAQTLRRRRAHAAQGSARAGYALLRRTARKSRARESRSRRKIGAKHAVASTSGTAAIHAAMMAAGISPGDEVIVPPITDMGTDHAGPVAGRGAGLRGPRSAHVQHGPGSRRAAITPKTQRDHRRPPRRQRRATSTRSKTICRRAQALAHRRLRPAHGCDVRRQARRHRSASSAASATTSSSTSPAATAGSSSRTTTSSRTSFASPPTSATTARPTSPDRDRQPSSATNYRMTELQGAVALAQLAKLDSIVKRRRSWCAG